MSLQKEKMNLVLTNWLGDIRFAIANETSDSEFLATHHIVTPLIEALTSAASEYSIKGLSVEFIETTDAAEMEQFLYTTFMHFSEGALNRVSMETGLFAYQENLTSIDFKNKSVYITELEEGPVRCEQTVGVPEFEADAAYVVAAKHWRLIRDKANIIEEVSIMLYKNS